MANSALRLENLIIVSSLVRFITEKVNLIKLLQKSQRKRLVPASGENVERDLAANWESQNIAKFLLKRRKPLEQGTHYQKYKQMVGGLDLSSNTIYNFEVWFEILNNLDLKSKVVFWSIAK